mmetsp:Transcript_38325/g.85332  ORF Transcript_38325/g.85332 Transcript_38325/m.85332 type:complete len:95 (-) Transcript_38325:254-538(-)
MGLSPGTVAALLLAGYIASKIFMAWLAWKGVMLARRKLKERKARQEREAGQDQSQDQSQDQAHGHEDSHVAAPESDDQRAPLLRALSDAENDIP